MTIPSTLKAAGGIAAAGVLACSLACPAAAAGASANRNLVVAHRATVASPGRVSHSKVRSKAMITTIPVIQAHRGAGRLGPENTLPSFQLTWHMGLVPEADIRATRDGVIVCFHDDNLKRLTPKAPPEIQSKAIGDLNWDQIAGLDAGAEAGSPFQGQRIPRLRDVFADMRGHADRRLYMDIKKVSFKELADLASEYGVQKQLIVASTRYDELKEWASLVPGAQTLLWMGDTEEHLRKRMEDLKAEDFRDITQLQIHVKVVDLSKPDPFAPSSEFLRETGRILKSHGILFQSLPLNSSTDETYHRLMALGVQSFATDDPKVALRAMLSVPTAR